jgi:hypothetical protein
MNPSRKFFGGLDKFILFSKNNAMNQGTSIQSNLTILALGAVLVMTAIAVVPSAHATSVNVGNVDCDQKQKSEQNSDQTQLSEQKTDQNNELKSLIGELTGDQSSENNNEQSSDQSNEASQDCNLVDIL